MLVPVPPLPQKHNNPSRPLLPIIDFGHFQAITPAITLFFRMRRCSIIDNVRLGMGLPSPARDGGSIALGVGEGEEAKEREKESVIVGFYCDIPLSTACHHLHRYPSLSCPSDTRSGLDNHPAAFPGEAYL